MVQNIEPVADFQAKLDAQLASSLNQLQTIVDSARESLGLKVGSVLDGVKSQVPGLLSQAVAANQTVTVDLPNQIAQAFQSIQGKVNGEILAKEAARISITDRIAAALTTVTSANANDFRDNIQLINDDYAYRQTFVDSISTSVRSFSTQESSRAVAKQAAVVADTSTANSAVSTALVQQISTEYSRATTRASTLVASAAASLKPQQNVGSDNSACSATSAGQLYYSTSSGTLFLCDGTWWVSLFPFSRAFANSRIIDQSLTRALTNRMSYSKWILCYSGTIHGWSSYTFHNNCNNRGMLWPIDSTFLGFVSCLFWCELAHLWP
jgi:hypothetical protein